MKMKMFFRCAVRTLLVCAIGYAFIAFGEWEANPEAWGDDLRILAAIAVGFFSLVANVITETE